MKKALEPEIKDYKAMEKAMESLRNQLNVIEKDIIRKYCPFKKGDNVIFTEGWRENDKDYFGIVEHIKLVLSEESIDGRWRICVRPATKNFKIPQGSFNKSYKYLGEWKGDVIRKA